MIAELTAALTSLHAASDLAQALMGVRDATLIQSKIIELQREILSAQASTLGAQESQAAMLKRVGELEGEVADLKAWDTEKQRYQLSEIRPGAFVYALKGEAAGPEPEHALCANCYAEGRKSILQEERVRPLQWALRCNRCRTDLWIPSREPAPVPILVGID